MRRPCFFHLAEGGLDTLCWNLIPTGGTRYLVQSLFCVRMRAGVFGRSGIFQKEKKGYVDVSFSRDRFVLWQAPLKK